MNQKFFEEAVVSVNALVDLKVAVHRHDAVVDDKTDETKVQLGLLDSENQIIRGENQTEQKFIDNNRNVTEVTASNVDSLVYPSNPVSKKMVELLSKSSAIEDGLTVVKKSLEKDNLPVTDLLKFYRQLCGKQFKQIRRI